MSKSLKINIVKIASTLVLTVIFSLFFGQLDLNPNLLGQDESIQISTHFSPSNHSSGHTDSEWIEIETEEESETDKAAKKVLQYAFLICFYSCKIDVPVSQSGTTNKSSDPAHFLKEPLFLQILSLRI